MICLVSTFKDVIKQKKYYKSTGFNVTGLL